MANKQSIVKVIRAKPNERGRTSHIPIICQTKECDNEAVIIRGAFHNRKKICWSCYENPPQVVSDRELVRRAIKMQMFGGLN